MKSIIINEKEIEIPNSWLDVSFEQFIAFSNITSSRKTESEVIEEYKEEGNEDDNEDIMSLVISLDNVDFNTKIVCFWTGLDESEIALCSLDLIEEILRTIDFVGEQYQPISLDKFTLNDETFFLPKGGMEDENFGTYIEAEQVELNNKRIENGAFGFLPRQIALLCKKEGEKRGLVNEVTIGERTEKFKKLDMATVWDVAFFLLKQESKLMIHSLTLLQTEETQRQLSQQEQQFQDMDG